MTEPFTAAEHYAARSAFRVHTKQCARAAANWAVALEHVAQHPGISIPELALLLAADARITWSRASKSIATKLSFGRNVDGAMGRAGIRSRKQGRTVRFYTDEQIRELERKSER